MKRFLYSIANLLTVKASSHEQKQASIHCIHLAPDGSTVASNGQVMIAVEPVSEEIKFPDVGADATPGEKGVNVMPETVELVIRNLPKGKRPEMMFAVLTKNDDGQVELTSTDMQHTLRTQGHVQRASFPEWQGVLQTAAAKGKTRICVDRRTLAGLLSTIDEACGGSKDGNPVVFLEVGGEHDPMLVRAVSPLTGQRIVGVSMPIDTHGRWLSLSRWERRVLGRRLKPKVLRRRAVRRTLA